MRLVLIWKDKLLEHEGADENFINEFKKYTVKNLIDHIENIVELETENIACTGYVYLSEENYIAKEDEYILYEAEKIDYHSFLVSLASLLNLINVEDRAPLIIRTAHVLHEVDKEKSLRFSKDIAEKVYFTFKHGSH